MQTLAFKAYPHQTNELREHLILKGFLEDIENSQVRLEMRENSGDADMTLDKALERARNKKAVTIIEEEDNKPWISTIQ